jgi:hypothetical protein
MGKQDDKTLPKGEKMSVMRVRILNGELNWEILAKRNLRSIVVCYTENAKFRVGWEE